MADPIDIVRSKCMYIIIQITLLRTECSSVKKAFMQLTQKYFNFTLRMGS